MKNLTTYAAIILLGVFTVSCSKDEDNDANLSSELVGTVWRSGNTEYSYRILRFTDKTNLTWTTKNPDSEPEIMNLSKYTLIGTTLRVTTDPGTQYALVWQGEIENGNKVSLKPEIGSNTMTFQKQ